MTHTQSLQGQSPIGLGINSRSWACRARIFSRRPTPAWTQGVNQGAAHIHDLDVSARWAHRRDPAVAEVQRLRLYHADAHVSPGRDTLAEWPRIRWRRDGWWEPRTGWRIDQRRVCGDVRAQCGDPAGSGADGHLSLPGDVFTRRRCASTAGSCCCWFYGTHAQREPALGIDQCAGGMVCRLERAEPGTRRSVPAPARRPSTLSNNINPVAGWESNVPPFGLIQIDGEQFSYFGRSNAGNTSPANTLYGIQCAQNGTARAAHMRRAPRCFR